MLIRILAERKAHAKKKWKKGRLNVIFERYMIRRSRFIDKEKLME